MSYIRSAWGDRLHAGLPGPGRSIPAATAAMDDLLVATAGPLGAAIEVGCGGGSLCRSLGIRGFDADAWRDPPEVALTEHLPLADTTLDTVLAHETLIYCHDLTVALREIARVLRSGGRLVAGETITGKHGALFHAPTGHDYGDWMAAFEAAGLVPSVARDLSLEAAEFYDLLGRSLPTTPAADYRRWSPNLRTRARLLRAGAMRRVIWNAHKP